MTDPAPVDGQPTAEQAAVDAAALEAASAGRPEAPPAVYAAPPSLADERPELVAGAAFAGGLAIALLLKRLAR